MGSIFCEYDSPALIINGSRAHVHVLSMLNRTITVAKLIEEVKKSSSKWIKSKGEHFNNFYWQTGYAAFGVGKHQIDNIQQYIHNQKEHHLRWTFKEEYILLLNKYSIKYDNRYIWD
jgi:REP element-mobilizing transposase RayT